MSKTYRNKLVNVFSVNNEFKYCKKIKHFDTNQNIFYDYFILKPKKIKTLNFKSKEFKDVMIQPNHKKGDLDCFELMDCKKRKLIKKERNLSKQKLKLITKNNYKAKSNCNYLDDIYSFDCGKLSNRKFVKCKIYPKRIKSHGGGYFTLGFLSKY